MCHAPILAPDGSSRAARYVTDEACAEFLTGIFGKGPHLRRNRSCWGSIYEGDWKYYRRLAEAEAQQSAEFINIFYGEDVSEKEAQKALKLFTECCPNAEITLLSGGQPVYYYMISAE